MTQSLELDPIDQLHVIEFVQPDDLITDPAMSALVQPTPRAKKRTSQISVSPYNQILPQVDIGISALVGEGQSEKKDYTTKHVSVAAFRMKSGNIAVAFFDGNIEGRHRRWLPEMSAYASMITPEHRDFWPLPTGLNEITNPRDYFRLMVIIYTETIVAHMGVSVCPKVDHLVPFHIISRDNKFPIIVRNSGQNFIMNGRERIFRSSMEEGHHYSGYCMRSDNHVSVISAGASAIAAGFSVPIFAAKHRIGDTFGVTRYPRIVRPQREGESDEEYAATVLQDTIPSETTNLPFLVDTMAQQTSDVFLAMVRGPKVGKIIT